MNAAFLLCIVTISAAAKNASGRQYQQHSGRYLDYCADLVYNKYVLCFKERRSFHADS